MSKTDSTGTTQYVFDARGRMTSAVQPSGATIVYTYDALGRRASRTTGTNVTTTTCLYSGGDVVFDSGSDGTQVDYLNGPRVDNKLKQNSSAQSGPLYFLQDQLHSTVALTDAMGNVQETDQYDPFGGGTGSSLSRYDFTGRERDPDTGLIYSRARWYDPSQGRFISQDPIGMAGGLNRYSYGANNPVSFSDPSGLSWKTFEQGLSDGGKVGFMTGVAVGAVLLAVTAATEGGALAALPALLSAFMSAAAAAAIAKQIAELVADFISGRLCKDKLDYMIGFLLGSIIGGLGGGALVAGLAGPSLAQEGTGGIAGEDSPPAGTRGGGLPAPAS
ncbi:MAG TPA: RHS repeat-associated core domain-containing protein, partial [Blastocatellia bacterium]